MTMSCARYDPLIGTLLPSPCANLNACASSQFTIRGIDGVGVLYSSWEEVNSSDWFQAVPNGTGYVDRKGSNCIVQDDNTPEIGVQRELDLRLSPELTAVVNENTELTSGEFMWSDGR
jgi:hypothetical protein